MDQRSPDGRRSPGGRRGGTPRLFGLRTVWRTVDDGEFFCSGCGGDRSYRLRDGRRRVVVLGLPVLPRGACGPVVECAACRGHFAPHTLDQPTTHRLATLLRDAQRTLALTVLAAGGSGTRAAREAAAALIAASGTADRAEAQLLTLLDASGDGPPRSPAALDRELRLALRPLAPHLASPGREALLLQAASVALADGPYEAAEEEVLRAAGCALDLEAADVRRLLAAARTPSQ